MTAPITLDTLLRQARGALFDLDGVLIDSETEYTRIWTEIESHFPTGIPGFALRIKGTTLPDILDTYFPGAELQERVKAMLVESEERMVYRLLPGVEAFLDRLEAMDIPAAIVTSSSPAKMERVYAQLPGFRERFRAVVTSADVTHSKPHPEGYLKAAERLGLPAEACLVFEDSIAGARAGRAAGARVVTLATTLPMDKISPEGHLTLPAWPH